jgi:hypothetical protein
MSSYCCDSGVVLVVDRPNQLTQSERVERKKTCLCPCGCPTRAGRPMTGEERIRMLKAKIVGNCCAPLGTVCDVSQRAYPTN